jgi:hypothetical protein
MFMIEDLQGESLKFGKNVKSLKGSRLEDDDGRYTLQQYPLCFFYSKLICFLEFLNFCHLKTISAQSTLIDLCCYVRR